MSAAPIAPYDDSVKHQVSVLVRAVNRTTGHRHLYVLAAR